MDISFENKTMSVYSEYIHQLKRTQENAECVVPDVNDDIGKIVSVKTAVFLKGKELNGKMITVSAESTASVLYITEGEDNVSYVSLSKPFTMEFEAEDLPCEDLAQIMLRVINSEARALNPRKISVTFEIEAELSCYRRELAELETILPDAEERGIHAKYEQTELHAVNSVCEKSFALSEQFTFPAGKPVPSDIISCDADFSISDTQFIGSKVIIKGGVNISLRYLSDSVCYPVCTEFTAPFSQIIDTGKEPVESCSAFIQLTSVFSELSDTINGEKAAEAELHAVIQLVSRCRQTISYISDAYCNLMPAETESENCKLLQFSDMQRLKLSADEHISIAEDCKDVLSVFTSLSQISAEAQKLRATAQLDIIYRNINGSLSAVHRNINMETEWRAPLSRILYTRLNDIYLRPDGAVIEAHIGVEICCQSCENIEFKKLSAIRLNEDSRFDFSEFPSLTLVRLEDESIWELAKLYHSSEKRIYDMNENPEQGGLLLIPKTV